MRSIHLTFLAATAAAILATSSAALADVAPPDGCPSGSIGQACNNAGPAYDQPGICAPGTCYRGTPDGGSVSYPCTLCEPTDSGAVTTDGGSSSDASSSGGNSSSGGSGSSSGSSDGGSTGGTSTSSKSGCATSPLTRDGATGLAMLALGVGALAWSRRRRP
jgi:hypothetical protein